MKPLIEVKQLHFSYDTAPILKALDFGVEKGQLLTILGPNGCGKTTLLKNMCAYLKPDKGKVYYENLAVDSFSAKERAKRLAVVHQSSATDFDFSVKDVILMGRYPHLNPFQKEGKKDLDWVDYVMKKTDVFALRDKSILEISGGERQRVLIARALAQESRVLYLDEPISHLDLKHQMNILKLCTSLIAERKMTIIMTLHDISLAFRFSHRIILMDKGEIVALGKPKEVLTKERIEAVYGVAVLILEDEDKEQHIVPKGGAGL